MSAGEILSLFGGAGGGTALAFCILFLTDWGYTRSAYTEMKAQRDEWKRTAELERARAEAGVLAGLVVKDAMVSLRKELE